MTEGFDRSVRQAPDSPLWDPGSTPEYLPPHLRGKVFDFRNEPDGNVSFYHPEASNGLSPELSRVKMTKEQYQQTFDRNHRMSDFTGSINGQYAPMERPGNSFFDNVNNGIGNALRKALDWGTSGNGKAVATTGLLSALGGGIGGYMWGRHSESESPIGRALLMALLAGGAGTAASMWNQSKKKNMGEALQRQNSNIAALAKTASSGVEDGIARILSSDPTIRGDMLPKLMAAISAMEKRDRDDLLKLLKTAAGAGAGMLVMRFLKFKGLLPMALGGIIGGMIGGSSSRDIPKNAFGQQSLLHLI